VLQIISGLVQLDLS